MRISKLIAFSILRIVGFRRCPAVSLSNAGSACKVILNLGFSLSRTPILQEPTRQPAGSSAKPTDPPDGGEFGEGNRAFFCELGEGNCAAAKEFCEASRSP